jgi:hypothetical protein
MMASRSMQKKQEWKVADKVAFECGDAADCNSFLNPTPPANPLRGNEFSCTKFTDEHPWDTRQMGSISSLMRMYHSGSSIYLQAA